jgi:serine/threonine protein kinase
MGSLYPAYVRGEAYLATRQGQEATAGVVLYEMATGTLPFRGESTGVVFESILSRTAVPLVRLNPDVPLDLERVIAKCLEKDRDLRYQHASEIRTDLQRLKRDTESGRTVAIPASPGKTRRLGNLWVVLAACIAAIGLAAFGFWYLRSGRTATQIDSIAEPAVNLSYGDLPPIIPCFSSHRRAALIHGRISM